MTRRTQKAADSPKRGTTFSLQSPIEGENQGAAVFGSSPLTDRSSDLQ
jgi:hypothetical protein